MSWQILAYNIKHIILIVLNAFKNEVRYNVMLAFENDCSRRLVSYLSQFGNPEKYHLRISPSKTKSENEALIDQKFDLYEKELKNQHVMIYNFINDTDLALYITLKYNTFKDINYNGLTHYSLDRKDIFSNLQQFKDTMIVNEFLNPNITDNKMVDDVGDISIELTDPTASPSGGNMNDYSNSEIVMYQMLEMLGKIFNRQNDLESKQVLFELFDKDLFYANMKFGLIRNLRLLANLMVCNVNEETLTGIFTLTNQTEIPVKYNVPIAVIQGQPNYTTCDVSYNDPVITANAIFIVLSFYGRNDRGYLDSHKLVATLAAIDRINELVYYIIIYYI